MGWRARAFFEEADRLGGLLAKIRLASLSRITSTEASTMEDTPEALERLGSAAQTVRQEFGRRGPVISGGEIVSSGVSGVEGETLRSHVRSFLDLMTQRSLFLGDVTATAHRINEAAASTLNVARASVWFLDSKRTKIHCADLFELRSAEHSSGVELLREDFPEYFAALETERTIAAHRAHTDPRTCCFSEVYLTPLGINSMLDVPIWVSGDMVGVLCHEHVGPPREWNGDEETFAYLMANFVALALERSA